MSTRWKNTCLMDGATSFVSMKGDTLIDDAPSGMAPSLSVFNGTQAAHTLCGDPSVQSILFDGVDDRAQFSDDVLWDITEPWSCEILFLADQGPGNIGTLILHGNSTNGVRLAIGGNNGSLPYILWHVNVTAGGDNDRTVAWPIIHGRVNHIVLSVASSDAVCYINGVAAGKTAQTSVSPNETGSIRFGSQDASTNRFKGRMNAVIYKDVELTATQALAHYQSAISMPRNRISQSRSLAGLR